jgi:2-polyprenyl-3-methyl-5-hydroxy-6-metoxy-1,4-benzoquinol methylase
MVAIEELQACPHCSSRTFEPADPCRDRLYDVVQGLEYARCRACRLLFLSTRVKESELHQLYPESYEPYRLGGSESPQPGPRAAGLAAKAVLVFFHRVVPDRLRGISAAHYQPPMPGATLVDFGCGSTAFLDQAAARGWSPIGVDFTPTVVEAVRSAGFEAYTVEDFWNSMKPGSVDAFRLNHVLEHLYEPWETLRRLHSLLSENGRIHIGVPNPLGLSRRLFGSDWMSLDARHTLLYQPDLARELLEQVGFRNIRIVQETLSKDLARSWGYRRARKGRMAADRVEPLALAPGINSLLTPPAKLAALLGMGDRYHLFATK